MSKYKIPAVGTKMYCPSTTRTIGYPQETIEKALSELNMLGYDWNTVIEVEVSAVYSAKVTLEKTK